MMHLVKQAYSEKIIDNVMTVIQICNKKKIWQSAQLKSTCLKIFLSSHPLTNFIPLTTILYIFIGTATSENIHG